MGTRFVLTLWQLKAPEDPGPQWMDLKAVCDALGVEHVSGGPHGMHIATVKLSAYSRGHDIVEDILSLDVPHGVKLHVLIASDEGPPIYAVVGGKLESLHCFEKNRS